MLDKVVRQKIRKMLLSIPREAMLHCIPGFRVAM